MIQIETLFLAHSGGTKFYETVLIRSADDKAMLIKRYGKMEAARTGGGETIVEYGNYASCRSSRDKIITDKQRSAKGYGQSEDYCGYGLHKLSTTGRQVAVPILRDYCRQHYTKNSLIESIDAYFDPDSTDTSPVTKATPTIDENVDRGTTWGCF